MHLVIRQEMPCDMVYNKFPFGYSEEAVGFLYFILNNFLRKRLGRRFYFRESSFDYGFTEVREDKVRAVFPEFNCLNNIGIIQLNSPALVCPSLHLQEISHDP